MTANFSYDISVASSTENDPDLYVSVYDGRWPVESDWDYSSAMYGADTVRIASDDNFWAFHGFNHSAGVLVVVGVKFSEIGNYTLLLSKEDAVSIKRIDIS